MTGSPRRPGAAGTDTGADPGTEPGAGSTSDELDSSHTLAETLADEERVGPDQAAPDEPGELGRAAARGVGITLVTQVLRSVVQFGSLVVLARLLLPSDFGVVASVTAIIGVADILGDFGLSAAAIQAKRLNDDERTNLFWINLGLGTAAAIVVAAAAPLINRVYGEQLTPITLSLAGLFVVSGAGVQFGAELSRALRFRVLALAGLSGQVAGAVIAIALAVAGVGYWAIVAQQLTPGLVVLAVNVQQCRWRPGLPKRHVSIRRFIRFGGGVLGTQLIAYATRNVDNIAVGAARGSIELGFYSRAYQLLITPLNLINVPMTRVALPVLSRVQDDDVRYARYLQRAQLVGCYLTATVLAVACGLASPVVAILFGPHWTAVVPMFAILAVGGVFRAVEQISYWMFLSRGKTGAQLRLYMITRPLMIALIVSGVIWGGVGVATTSSIGYFLYWIVSLIAAGKATRVDVRPLFAKAGQAIVLVAGPCGLLAFVATLIVANPVAQVGVGLALAAGYLVLVCSCVARIGADARLVLGFARESIKARG